MPIDLEDFHLAQLNVAHPRYPTDDPGMAEFMAALDHINALADASPGFVWRLVDDSGANATSLRHPLLEGSMVNLSVWQDRDSLRNYVYRSGHLDYLRRRNEWFRRSDGPFLVLWWVPAGHIPSLDEAVDRLLRLRRDGSTPSAFTFRDSFSYGGAPPVVSPATEGEPRPAWESTKPSARW